MARQVLNTTTTLNAGRVMLNDMTQELYALTSDTINAGAAEYQSGATVEARVQLAINAAVSQGKSVVFVPASMLPYDAALVTFNSSVQMIREGQIRDVYDVKAYGAAGDNVVVDTAAFSGCIGATPVGKTIYTPDGNYLTGQVSINKRLVFVGAGPERTNFVAQSGATGPLIDYNPSTTTSFCEVGAFRVDMANAISQTAVRFKNLSDSLCYDIEVSRGAIGVDIDSTGSTTLQRFNIRNCDTAAIRVLGDAGGEIYIERCDIIRDIVGVLAVGIQLSRTTLTDTGGLYLHDVRIVKGASGSITRGYEFVSTAGGATGVFAFLVDCVADGSSTAALELNNVQNVSAVASFFTTTNPGSAVKITGGQDYRFSTLWLDGGAGGKCIDADAGTIQHLTVANSRFNQGTAFFINGGVGGGSWRISNNNYTGTTVTNDNATFAALTNTAAAAIAVAASPFTYTNTDGRPQMVYISGGTVSSIAKNAVTIFTNTDKSVWLNPSESVIVTYSSLPIMVKDGK